SASYGSAVRRAALERTMVLAERAGNWRTWVVAALLIASSDSGNGQYERARALTEKALRAEGADETERTLLASVALTTVDHWQGRLVSALGPAERARLAGKRWSRQDFRSVIETDQFVAGSGYAAWSLAQMGRLDDAFAPATEGVSHAERCGS